MTQPVTGHSVVPETKAARLPSSPAEVGKQRTLDSVDPIGRTEVLLYGAPKSGKTVLTATFPPPFRWIAADGETSLKSVRWAFKDNRTSFTDMKDLVFYVPQEDNEKGGYPTTAKAFHRMQDMQEYWFSPSEVGKWQTLVIDSATELSEWAINLGLSLNRSLPNKDKPLSRSHDFNVQAAARVFTGEQDYKSAMAMFESWLIDTRVDCARHGKNLVVICHEWKETATVTDQDTGDEREVVLRYRPLLIGQLRERITKSFDDVWHTEMFNGKEVKVQVHEDPKIIAGTRWGQCLNKYEDADYRKMIEKVRKYHGTAV